MGDDPYNYDDGESIDNIPKSEVEAHNEEYEEYDDGDYYSDDDYSYDEYSDYDKHFTYSDNDDVEDDIILPIPFIGENNGVNYLGNLPNIILKRIVDCCLGIDCLSLSMTCKTIKTNIEKVINLSDNLLSFIDPCLELNKTPITTLTRWCFWKNNYICFPAVSFTALANKNYFDKKVEAKCVFNQHYYLQSVWWLEMGNKNIKNVPIAEYDVYWRVKTDYYTKPIMFHCSVLIGDQVHIFRKGIMGKTTNKKWRVFKTNSITLPKELLDDVASKSSSLTTMSVKCSLFNIDYQNIISELYVDCFHLVPKDSRMYYITESLKLISIDQEDYDPRDSANIYATTKEGVEHDYFELSPGIYDYDSKKFGF